MSRSARNRRQTKCGVERNVAVDPEQMRERSSARNLRTITLRPRGDQTLRMQMQDAAEAEMHRSQAMLKMLAT